MCMCVLSLTCFFISISKMRLKMKLSCLVGGMDLDCHNNNCDFYSNGMAKNVEDDAAREGKQEAVG